MTKGQVAFLVVGCAAFAIVAAVFAVGSEPTPPTGRTDDRAVDRDGQPRAQWDHIVANDSEEVVFFTLFQNDTKVCERELGTGVFSKQTSCTVPEFDGREQLYRIVVRFSDGTERPNSIRSDSWQLVISIGKFRTTYAEAEDLN